MFAKQSLKYGIYFFGLILCNANAFSQELLELEKPDIILKDCGSDVIHNTLMQNDSLYRKSNEDFEKLMEEKKRLKKENTRIVPLLIHVLYVDGTSSKENLYSTQKIERSLKQVNQQLMARQYEKGHTYFQFEIAGNDGSGIISHDLSKNKKYKAKGIIIHEKKGVKGIKNMNFFGGCEDQTCLPVYLVNKINGLDCAGNTYDVGYIQYNSATKLKDNGAFIQACSFIDLKNNLEFMEQLAVIFELYSTHFKENKIKKRGEVERESIFNVSFFSRIN